MLLGDGRHRDLAGLVIPGIIGDGQQLAGKNLEIFNEGIANGIIEPDRGITLPGRDMAERWYMAMSPYIDGISGNEQLVADLIDQASRQATGENTLRLDTLLSQVVLERHKRRPRQACSHSTATPTTSSAR